MVDSLVLDEIKKDGRVDSVNVKKMKILIEFIKKNDIGFFTVSVRNEGNKQFVEVFVSLKTCGQSEGL